VVVELVGAWSAHSNELAALRTRQSSSYDEQAGLYTWVEHLPDWIEDGAVLWLSIIDSDQGGEDASAELAAEWAGWYPSDDVAILADTSGEDWARYLAAVSAPALIVLDAEGGLVEYSGDLEADLEGLAERLGY